MKLKFYNPFSMKQKRYAKTFTENELKNRYKQTEKDLAKHSKNNDWETWRKVMKEHRDYEYAMYYKTSLGSKKTKMTGNKNNNLRRNKK